MNESFNLAVSTHSRLKAAVVCNGVIVLGGGVSTHSRLKAADMRADMCLFCLCFNTQPPEGGCFMLLPNL